MTDSLIILALDGMDAETALGHAAELKGQFGAAKVNSGIIKNGCSLVSSLAEYGPAFADCKFHDIAFTNGNGIKDVVEAGASFLTIHASMGVPKMRAAKAAAQAAAGDRKITVLAITVLTDMTEEACQSVYFGSIKEVVLRLARLAAEAGMDGIVCSPQELKYLNEERELRDLAKATPNIRGSDTEVPDDDQNPKRKATPAEAVSWGATWTVIGRMITKPKDGTSAEAVVAINSEIADAQAAKASSD